MLDIFKGSDTYIEFDETTDTAVPATRVTSATVTADLSNDQTGAALAPQIAMAHVATGLYRGTVADDHAGLEVGMRVRILYTIDDGAGRHLEQEEFAVVKIRKT